jgi:hypothetical protein
MWKLPIRDYLLLLLVLGVVTALIWADFNIEWFRIKDVDHPGVGALLAGFLVAATGILVFDTVRTHLANKRWKAVSDLTLLALSRELTIVIDVLLWLGSGRLPKSPIGVETPQQTRMVKIRKKHHLCTWQDPDYGKLAYNSYFDWLEALAEDTDWCDLAEDKVSRLKDQHRQSIVRLLPAMFLTSDALGILNRVVLVNHWLSAIQSHLNALAKTRHVAVPEQVTTEWMAFLAEAISLREDLWFKARPTSRVGINNRGVLDRTYQNELEKRRRDSPRAGSRAFSKLIASPVEKTRLTVL